MAKEIAMKKQVQMLSKKADASEAIPVITSAVLDLYAEIATLKDAMRAMCAQLKINPPKSIL